MALSIDKAIIGGGLIAIGATVFAESGLLIGFFLPGDTLLFGAGIAAAAGKLPLDWLLAVTIASAIVGDNVGYSIGRRTGPRIFKRKDSILFKKEYIAQAEAFYKKHGGKTIVIARFVPIVRTFAPMVAGIGKMDRKRFMAFNVVGGILWGGGVTLLGYYVGSKLPWTEDYIGIIILGVVIVSVFGSVGHILKEKENRAIISQRIKKALSSILLNKKID